MRILIFGGGGHAKVMIESLRASDPAIELAILDDDEEKVGHCLLGVHIVGGRDWIDHHWPDAPVALAVGGNAARSTSAAWFRERSRSLQRVVDPSARLSSSAIVGEGAFLAPSCTVNADARIGDLAIVNTAASVDHDCIIGEAAHIAPGARLCGSVAVGARSLVGAGAIIVPGVRIGSDAIVGAGATVLRDVPDGGRVCGTPARPL